jgi:hypothetical protein
MNNADKDKNNDVKPSDENVGEENPKAETEVKEREKFIPIRKEDVIDLICKDGKLDLKGQEKFKEFCTILESMYHRDFHQKQKELKKYYYPFNPDLDIVKMRDISKEDIEKDAKDFMAKLEEVLIDANYEKVTEKELDYALDESSLYKVSLIVDFDDFKEFALYKRGETQEEVEVKKLFGLIKKKIKVDMYERVVIYLRFKDEEYFVNKALGKYEPSTRNKFVNAFTKVERFFRTKKREKILKKLSVEPNSTTLKLFKNVPKADIEMLFPNTRIFMNLKDMLLLGIPALAGVISAFVSRVIVAIGLIVGVVFVFLTTESWDQSELMEMLKTTVRAFAALFAFAAYILRQWNKYKNKKINFMKELSENLYFKNLDNNMGVFANLIDSAEEQEFKEAVLGYYFLLIEKEPIKEDDLDKLIEKWIYKHIQLDVDFEIKDALRKLNELGLTVKDENDAYTVVSIDESLKRMDYLWDNYFTYNV